jgi:SAM-dependent methyltransferase
MIPPEQDAYGREVYDYYLGEDVREIVERDDGFIGLSGGPKAYFAPFAEWPAIQQEAIQLAHGRCLDIGCGPGRVCLYLQEKGLNVVGIDNSPLAVKTAQLRGVQDARVIPITRVSRNVLGQFETMIMFGNNFGLFGNAKRAKWLLRRFYKMTARDGRILAESRNIYGTGNPEHLANHERNRQLGRMAGQVRIRVRYRSLIGPWFDYLMVSQAEMAEIVAGTGWHISRFIEAEDGPDYTAVLQKT